MRAKTQLLAVVNGGLNRQQDYITYEYTNPTAKSELLAPEEEEEEEVGTNQENKENNLPDYVPPYFPPFPVMIAPEENEEFVLVETKTQLPTLLNDALPLPNIVKKKNKPVDNPFTFLKPFDESMLSITDSDQPEALSLSMKIGVTHQISLLSKISEEQSDGHSKKRRRSETLLQLIDQIQYPDLKGEPKKRRLTNEINLFNESTREGATPGNTMFSLELGILDKLMTGNAPPIAVPKLMAPNLLMDIVVPQGPAISSSSTTLRLNMSPTNSRKLLLGGITIEESAGSSAIPTPTDTQATEITPTTIKIAPISLAALSSHTEEKKTKEKPIKKPKEKKPKSTKSKKKLTISLPKPQSDSILANISQEPVTEDPPSTVSSATTPVIRFSIKPPTEQKSETTPPQSPKSTITSDVIRCVCENPTVDYGAFMVACDTCRVWFHGQCVGIAENDQIEEWHCDGCVTKK